MLLQNEVMKSLNAQLDELNEHTRWTAQFEPPNDRLLLLSGR